MVVSKSEPTLLAEQRLIDRKFRGRFVTRLVLPGGGLRMVGSETEPTLLAYGWACFDLLRCGFGPRGSMNNSKPEYILKTRQAYLLL